MARKLQIIDTVTETVKFTFTNIPTIIRLGWVSFILCLVIFAGLGGAVHATTDWQIFAGLSEGEIDTISLEIGTAVLKVYGAIFAWSIISMLLLVPYMVVIRQVAAGTIEPPGGIGYFRFGGRELRFVAANIILALMSGILFAILLIPVGVVALTVFGNDGTSDPVGPQIALMILVYLVALIPFVWFMVRACLFTTAAAIEDTAAPFGSFSLTRGNVWRLIGAFLLFLVLIMVVEIGLQFVLTPIFMVGFTMVMPAMTDGGEVPMTTIIIIAAVAAICLLLYIALRLTLESVLPAKIYQNLMRPEEDPAVSGDTPHSDPS